MYKISNNEILMDKIRPVHINYKKEIDEICYLQQQYEYAVDSTHANSSKAIGAYHSWYNKTLVVCNRAFGSDDADLKIFRSVDNGGNGYCLNTNYYALLSTYSILMDRLTSLPLEATAVCKEKPVVCKEAKPLIFISHAGNDKAIVKLFVDYILKNGLGLRDENIVCTSFEETTMKGGENIPLYIKKNIKEASAVLSMVSQNYRRSEACMNEVGAAWALDNPPIQIVLPDADFDSIGWLVCLNKALKISERSNLDKLYETLCKRIEINKPSITSWNGTVTSFLEKLPDVCLLTSKPHVYLTFENDSTELDVDNVTVEANFYIAEQPKVPKHEPGNSMLWGHHTFAAIESIRPNILPTVSIGGCKKNQSMMPIRFLVHNEHEYIENVDVFVDSEEVNFSDSNVSGGLIVTPLHSKVCIESHKCIFNMGDINPGTKHKTTEVFIEFQSLYNDYDSYEFSEEETYTFHLNYLISTKSGPHRGTLTLNVKPSYIRNFIENNKKSGRVRTKAYTQ